MTAPETSPSPNPNVITPTIGRRLWFWPALASFDRSACNPLFTVIDPSQPFDAGVIYVWNDRMVNLSVTDHNGGIHAITSVRLLQVDESANPGEAYAQWMPYQAGQSAAEKVLAKYDESVANAYPPTVPGGWGKLTPPTLIIGDTAYPDGATATGVAPLPALSPAQQDLETEIQAKANNGPRVTPQALLNEIDSVHFFTAWQGVSGAAFDAANPDGVLRPFSHSAPPELCLLTICVLVLRNGYTVIGHSACASPENYNKEIGERIARENAERQVWPLLGFRLRDKLAGDA